MGSNAVKKYNSKTKPVKTDELGVCGVVHKVTGIVQDKQIYVIPMEG